MIKLTERQQAKLAKAISQQAAEFERLGNVDSSGDHLPVERGAAAVVDVDRFPVARARGNLAMGLMGRQTGSLAASHTTDTPGKGLPPPSASPRGALAGGLAVLPSTLPRAMDERYAKATKEALGSLSKMGSDLLATGSSANNGNCSGGYHDGNMTIFDDSVLPAPDSPEMITDCDTSPWDFLSAAKAASATA